MNFKLIKWVEIISLVIFVIMKVSKMALLIHAKSAKNSGVTCAIEAWHITTSQIAIYVVFRVKCANFITGADLILTSKTHGSCGLNSNTTLGLQLEFYSTRFGVSFIHLNLPFKMAYNVLDSFTCFFHLWPFRHYLQSTFLWTFICLLAYLALEVHHS